MFKVCACCKKEKEIIKFSKDSKRSDGYYVYCKDCVKEKNRQRYLKNKESINQRNKAWKKANRGQYLAQQREYNRAYHKTIPGKYREYKQSAFRRNYTWALSKEAFAQYWQVPCYYCGDEIDTIGIDRINNDLGYIESNIVSCCSVCNRAKDTMSKEQYIEHCKKVSKRLSE